jgi:ligand-binding sensor domain-containing protein/signal transduction histidine kinase
LILIHLIGCICLNAQDSNLRFRNLSVDDGLSSNTVLAIIQDSKGRMWIGTADGLNLFDGSQFIVYKHFKNDTNSLIDNYISTIIEAPDGNLWIGCSKGICIYNPELDIFSNFNSLLKKSEEIKGNVTSIVFENKDLVWIGSNRGLFRLDFKTMELKRYENSQLAYVITQIYIDKNKNLWIGTQSGGVVFFDRLLDKFVKFKGEKYTTEVFSVNSARTIFEDSRGNIWVGSDLGLEQYDVDSRTYRTHYYDPNNPKGPLQNMVRSIFEDSHKRLWVGYNNGLTIYDQDKNEFILVKNQVGNPRSIAAEEVWCMTQDKQGSVWFGFYTSGISIFDYDKSHFKSFCNDPNNLNSLAGNYVNNFCEDKFGNIWIATGHKGFDYYNFKTNTFTHYKNDPKNKNSLSSDAVLSIDIDHEGILWIGSWGGGLNRFDPTTKTFTHYIPKRNDSNSINGIHIWRALEDKDHNLLIATQQEGLGYYIREKKIFKTYVKDPNNPKSLASNSVNCVYRDKQDVIWVGTSLGLSKLEDNQFNFKNYLADSTYIYDVYNDNKGTLWIGTTEGLFALNLKTDSMHIYTIEDGLGSNSVVGLLEDSHKNIWLSTNNGGISIINIDNRKIQNLTVNHGLISNSFKKRARLKLTDGRMLFGTNEGYMLFHPDSINMIFPTPKIILSDFRINNKSIKITDKDAPLKKHITFADTIILNHDQTVFSIYYTALNYVAPERSNYAYIMQGFDNSWNYMGSIKDANYTNLDPGKYKFRVKVSVNRGIWSDDEASVTIIILPPYYKTWWFRTILVSLIVFILLLFYYLRIAQIRRINIQLKKMVDERTTELALKNEMMREQNKVVIESNTILKEQKQFIEEQADELSFSNEKLIKLNATKDKFFNIIAHDLRNPFTSILGFCELLTIRYDKMDDVKRKHLLGVVFESSKNLFKLLENLLEWARSQTGSIKYQPEEFFINELIASNISLVESLVQDKKLEIKQNLKRKIKIFADKNMINTVIRNLISNAIKFTDVGGITIEVVQDEDKTKTSITDTGVGISQDNIGKIFEVMSSKSTQGIRGESGTGLGLIICKEFIEKQGGTIAAISEVGKGSTFYFTIPNKISG